MGTPSLPPLSVTTSQFASPVTRSTSTWPTAHHPTLITVPRSHHGSQLCLLTSRRPPLKKKRRSNIYLHTITLFAYSYVRMKLTLLHTTHTHNYLTKTFFVDEVYLAYYLLPTKNSNSTIPFYNGVYFTV